MDKMCLVKRCLNKILGDVRLLHIPLDILVAGVMAMGGHKLLSELGILAGDISVSDLVLYSTFLAIVLFPIVVRVFDARVGEKAYMLDVWGRFKRVSIPVLAFCFMCFIYLPSETFISNNYDFEFSYQTFIPHQIVVMVECFLVMAGCFSLWQRAFFEIGEALVFGLNLAVYIQYMFLNGRLNLLDGSSPVWSDYRADIIAGYLIWGVLFAVPMLLMWKGRKLWEHIRMWIPAFLGGIQLVTLCSLLITAPPEAFIIKLKGNYMSPDEQFIVSAKDNVILMVWDAVDNAYIKELLDTEPEQFEGLEDFSIYLNTCSVYDATLSSMAQMLAGMELEAELTRNEWHERAWKTERAVEFYGRLHEAGYVVNAFNLESTTVDNFKGRFDNYRVADDAEESELLVNKERMYEKFGDLIAYRTLPMGLKRLVESEELSFTDIVTRRKRSYTNNREYAEHLELALSDKEQDYFVVEHLEGTHDPCPDKIEETKFLLGMLKEYIGQLKALGVYEDATVLVVSDHGEHNGNDPTKASTPIFMVKGKGDQNEELVLKNAPVYYDDMQATLLDCAGLYDRERDRELFGSSAFDIPEDMQRERTWYDMRADSDYPMIPFWDDSKVMSSFNVYYVYTYIGDTAVLEQMVREGRHTSVCPLKNYRG
ncbi:MAG: hypothetical protein NC092_02320 [Butyrivibrio sp.]|nr:hypothetical protein [Butyrivibrio sp.]